MREEELRRQLIALIEDIAPEADLSSFPIDKNYQEHFGLDSMDLLTIVERIAEETSVEVPETDYEKILTLEGLTAYVHARI